MQHEQLLGLLFNSLTGVLAPAFLTLLPLLHGPGHLQTCLEMALVNERKLAGSGLEDNKSVRRIHGSVPECLCF